MSERYRHTGELSSALRAQGLKRADIVACKRITGVDEGSAANILLRSGVNGIEIAAARQENPYENTRSRMVAASLVLGKYLTAAHTYRLLHKVEQ